MATRKNVKHSKAAQALRTALHLQQTQITTVDAVEIQSWRKRELYAWLSDQGYAWRNGQWIYVGLT